MSTKKYAHPEALVHTAWLAQRLNDPNVRIIESNEAVSLYNTGHIPGARNRLRLERMVLRLAGCKPWRALNYYVLHSAEFVTTRNTDIGALITAGSGKRLFTVAQVNPMMLHRRVQKASQILSVTPSAVSHALSRLRQSIGDELFIPTESGMQPTQRCA